MFANATKQVGISQQVVATLVASALLLLSIGVHIAQAANLVNVSDLVSTSEPGVTASHNISFDIPAGSALADGDTVTITFEVGSFAVGALSSGDVTVTVDGLTDPHASFATTTNTISFDSVTAAAASTTVVAIPDGFITNPAAAQSGYELTIDTGTGGDTGKTRVAIVEVVTISAIVDTVFNFIVTGTATSTLVNGDTTTGSTTATAVNFGKLVADTPEVLAQDLSVETNAISGFVVTVNTDGDLRSTNGAVIDTFTDGTDISTAGTAWASPLDNITLDNTWGHWGITYEDDATQDLAAGEYIAASTTPREVFSHDGPADASTTNIGTTTVGFQIEITPLQEAADDYQTILTYIATPTF